MLKGVSRSSYQITLPLKDEDDFIYRNLTVGWRLVCLPVKFRIIRLIFLEHVVNDREQHSGNSDDGFLVTSALFESKVAISDFRELFSFNGGKSALNKQRFDVDSSSADSGAFLLPGTFVVLRRKTSQEHKYFEVENTDIPTPISEMMPIAAKDWIPGAVITRFS